MSKTLLVYVGQSFYRYHDLYSVHFYDCISGQLYVYKKNTINAEEDVVACFKNWDYYLIE